MTYYGDFPTGASVPMEFDTFAAATGAPTATSNFTSADVLIYKNSNTTERTSANGITVTTSFDGKTGLQTVDIDTSDNTDAGFYAAGNEYRVAITPITADGQTMTFWLGTFSIQRAGGVLATLLARTPNAAAGASGGLLISGSNAGTTTLAALTVTGSMTVGDGLLVSRSSSNTSAATFTGNGTGSGIVATSGSGATGDGIRAVAASTNGAGMTMAHSGSGADLNATTTPLVLAKTTNLTGLNDIAATAVVSAGAITTSGGKVAGVILADTLTTYTGNTPQTGDSFARIGVAGVGLTNLGDTRIANLDAAVTTRMATYTQPTGFLAAAFPSGTVANTTNITAGTITTATNLTNAPTAGDFTATMKTSLNAATPASIVGAVGSVTGNVGGNVTGSVGSVVGAAGSVTGAVGSVTGNVGGNVVGSVASVTASVTVGAVASAASNIKKNTTIDLSFPMTDETTHELLPGLTVAAQRSIDNAAFAPCVNAVTEIGSTGVYATTLAAADTNGDTIMYLFTATGADDRLVEIITQP